MGRLLAFIGALGMLIGAVQLYAGGRGQAVALAKRGAVTPSPPREAR